MGECHTGTQFIFVEYGLIPEHDIKISVMSQDDKAQIFIFNFWTLKTSLKITFLKTIYQFSKSNTH